MNSIIHHEASFETPDGEKHKTWNAARRHMTGADLLDCIRKPVPNLSEAEATAIRDALLADWHISRKRKAP